MGLAAWMRAAAEVKVTPDCVRVEGARMHFLTAGEGPDVFLVHGLLGSAAAWEPSLGQLALDSTVYAIDALGMGGSDRVPNLDVSLQATARRLMAFMDACGIQRADFVGTSHGGAVVLMFAALYPERVRSVVLHAPANPFSDIADPLIRFYCTALGRWFAHQVPGVPSQLQTLALGRMYGDARRMREGSVERYVGPLRVPGTVDYVLSILSRWFDDMEALRTVLDRVRFIPALLLWGDHDRAVSLRSADTLMQYFDRVEFAMVAGAGHLPFEEAPQAFCAPIGAFLRTLDRHATDQAAVGARDAA
jgi:4,5:9,10-diseco-3-hydroxy-5,9,17-trioxoandrosta-1(10),2-diene-4-oate hydrolase